MADIFAVFSRGRIIPSVSSSHSQGNKKKMKGKRDSRKGEMTGKRMQQWTGRGADVVDRDEEKEETERGGKERKGRDGGGCC